MHSKSRPCLAVCSTADDLVVGARRQPLGLEDIVMMSRVVHELQAPCDPENAPLILRICKVCFACCADLAAFYIQGFALSYARLTTAPTQLSVAGICGSSDPAIGSVYLRAIATG